MCAMFEMHFQLAAASVNYMLFKIIIMCVLLFGALIKWVPLNAFKVRF